jgi:hypothetical protein
VTTDSPRWSSSLKVFGIDIDAFPTVILVALSRAGQTIRASSHTFTERVGIWGKGRSIFVLYLSLLRAFRTKMRKKSIRWISGGAQIPRRVHRARLPELTCPESPTVVPTS